jgi:hypothetical protein
METRNYVPNILATVIIAKNPERWGFTAKAEPAIAYDIVNVNNAVDLHLVADAADTSYDYLLALNPELKRGITPPGLPYGLRVPVGKGKPLQVALNRHTSRQANKMANHNRRWLMIPSPPLRNAPESRADTLGDQRRCADAGAESDYPIQHRRKDCCRG